MLNPERKDETNQVFLGLKRIVCKNDSRFYIFNFHQKPRIPRDYDFCRKGVREAVYFPPISKSLCHWDGETVFYCHQVELQNIPGFFFYPGCPGRSSGGCQFDLEGTLAVSVCSRYDLDFFKHIFPGGQ